MLCSLAQGRHLISVLGLSLPLHPMGEKKEAQRGNSCPTTGHPIPSVSPVHRAQCCKSRKGAGSPLPQDGEETQLWFPGVSRGGQEFLGTYSAKLLSKCNCSCPKKKKMLAKAVTLFVHSAIML
jgi:hypothetical protein